MAANFIRSSFRTIWSLELLLHMKREQGRSWSRKELVAVLRGSDLIVTQSLDYLLAAGLVSIDETGDARYQPVSQQLAGLVEEAEALYARSPDAVRRMIISTNHNGLSAFADAFRIRRD